MKRKLTFGFIVVLILSIAASMALAGCARGGPGWGPGRGGPMGGGYGWRHGGPGSDPSAYGRMGYDELDREFNEDTAELQNKLQQKYNEMERLMSSAEVETEKVLLLQHEINELNNELSRKRLARELEFRKNNPGDSGYYGPRGGYPGAGFGPGYCWR